MKIVKTLLIIFSIINNYNKLYFVFWIFPIKSIFNTVNIILMRTMVKDLKKLGHDDRKGKENVYNKH